MWEIKVFAGDRTDLETRVNEWLKEQLGIEVFQITQTQSNGANSRSEITLTILFRSLAGVA
jgi:hypothetical protein